MIYITISHQKGTVSRENRVRSKIFAKLHGASSGFVSHREPLIYRGNDDEILYSANGILRSEMELLDVKASPLFIVNAFIECLDATFTVNTKAFPLIANSLIADLENWLNLRIISTLAYFLQINDKRGRKYVIQIDDKSSLHNSHKFSKVNFVV